MDTVEELRAEVERLRKVLTEEHGAPWWVVKGYDWDKCKDFGVLDEDLPDDSVVEAELCLNCPRWDDCNAEIQGKLEATDELA